MEDRRMTGKTTRSVDSAVQDLFTKGFIVTIDPSEDNTTASNRHFKNMIIKRLESEHTRVKINVEQKGNFYVISLQK